MSQEKKKKSDLKVGDTIKCHDPDDMIDTMNELVKSGVETDFMYKKDEKEGTLCRFPWIPTEACMP